MDLSKFLYFLKFPADFERNLRRVELRSDTCSRPVLSDMDACPEQESEYFFCQSTITALEDKLALNFEEGLMINGKVCFANTDEVRPDFRTNFTGGDLLNYIFALLPAEGAIDDAKVYLPFPEDADHFWTQVERGQVKKEVK